MKKKNNVFLTSEESRGLLPELQYDLLLAEGPYPFLFTCTDKEERHTYLIVCHISDGEKTEWIVAERPLEQVTGLLRDQVSMRNAFGAGSDPAYVVTRRGGDVTVSRATIRELSDILPTPGCYLEAEEGEFDEEIRILRQRSQRLVKSVIQTVVQPKASKGEVRFREQAFYPHQNSGRRSSHKIPLLAAMV